jgi:energy-converting hydrogenase Eha subunit B
MVIGDVLKVLRYGSAISSAAIWKNRTAAGAAIAGLLGSLLSILRVMGVHVPVLSDAQINGLASDIAGIGGLAVWLFLTLTDKSVGLPAKPSTADVERMEHDAAAIPAHGADAPDLARGGAPAMPPGRQPAPAADDNANPFRDRGGA